MFHLVPNLKTDNEIHHERELICFQNLLRLSFSVGENGRICLKADKNCLTVQNRKKEKCRKRAHLELRVSPTHTGILTNFSEILWIIKLLINAFNTSIRQISPFNPIYTEDRGIKQLRGIESERTDLARSQPYLRFFAGLNTGLTPIESISDFIYDVLVSIPSVPSEEWLRSCRIELESMRMKTLFQFQQKSRTQKFRMTSLELSFIFTPAKKEKKT